MIEPGRRFVRRARAAESSCTGPLDNCVTVEPDSSQGVRPPLTVPSGHVRVAAGMAPKERSSPRPEPCSAGS